MPDKKVMLSVKKDGDGESEPKKKKVKLKDNKETTSQYGLYSGIVDENGKTNNTPTELEAMRNMFDYMRNNQPPESDNPSNVYRPKFSHITMAYKKKNQTNA